MRKMMLFGLAALMLGLLSTACVDQIAPTAIEEEKQPDADGNTMVFKAILEQGDAATKTALNNENAVVWSEGDEIRVYNSSHINGVVFTLTSGAGSVEGQFTGTMSGDGPYYAVYPADAAGAMTAGPMTFHISVPEVQTFANGSFGKKANISWAMAETQNSLFFHNVFGAVSISLKGTATIKQVNLYTRGADVLNGELSITNLGGDGAPWITLTGNASDEDSQHVSLDCGYPGIALDETTPTSFCLSVPAGAFADGFFVEIIDTENKAMIKSAKGSSANIIERGVILTMDAFTYAPQYRNDFLSELDDFAGYTEITDGVQKTCKYSDQDPACQYAYINSDEPSRRYVRFQYWGDAVNDIPGYALSLDITPRDMSLNAKPTVTVKAMGETGSIASKTGTMKVIKKTSRRAWLYDAASDQGYVIKLED